MREHDKIINAAAKKVLSPKGLFRKGTSRVWLDDNGYFITQVEFQPSAREKGSFLNVGISFLWEYSEVLNTRLAFSYGYRVDVDNKQFVRYHDNNEEFIMEMERFADVALQRVLEYRRFCDLNYAKEMLAQRISDKCRLWHIYDMAMICFLKGDLEEGTRFFNEFVCDLKDCIYEHDYYIEWRGQLYNRCVQYIQPRLDSKQSAQKMILEMIERRRKFFGDQPSFKNMNKEFKEIEFIKHLSGET